MNKEDLKGKMNPESLMMSYGYKPSLSEGAAKPPIFQTSTFVFENAESGKHFFELAYGLKEKLPTEEMGLIYSRLNNPSLEIPETRLCLWDKADDCALFSSGMAAISTVAFAFLKPGDSVLFFEPAYGGTEYLFANILPSYNINVVHAPAGLNRNEIEALIDTAGIRDNLKLIYLETPANPTNTLSDVDMISDFAKSLTTPEKKVLVAVDNTFLGPVFQHPLKHGADLVIYSATKYIGGHSDIIAGVVLGYESEMKQIKGMRTFLGNMADPFTGWLISRSLETLKLRMTAQSQTAKLVAEYLHNHQFVKKIYYLGNIEENTEQYQIYKKHCLEPGSMISFDIKGGEKEAFAFLNALNLFKLAVSLGATESLAQHPATMTHSDISKEDQKKMGISEKMIRLSIGLEASEDLIADIESSFKVAFK